MKLDVQQNKDRQRIFNTLPQKGTVLPTSIAFGDILLDISGPPLFVMEKSKNTTAEKNRISGKQIFLEMAEVLNEIRIDFELPDEHLEREEKTRLLKEIRDDLTDIFWNYDLVKRNKYDDGNDQN